MKRLIAVSVTLATFAKLAGPAYAQQKQKEKTPLQEEYSQKKAEQERIEKQYEAAMKRNRTDAAAPAATDPWANMRGTDDSKAKRQ